MGIMKRLLSFIDWHKGESILGRYYIFIWISLIRGFWVKEGKWYLDSLGAKLIMVA